MEIFLKAAVATTIVFPLLTAGSATRKSSATLASGDFKVLRHTAGSWNSANPTTATPTEISTSGVYALPLTATELTPDDQQYPIIIACHDAAGAEWDDTAVLIRVFDRDIEDLSYPTVSGRSTDVTTTGEVGIDWANIGAPTTTVNLSGTTVKTATDVTALLPTALISGRIDASVGAIAANAITATSINADAITAAKLASDVTTEIQTGLATAASIAALNNLSAAQVNAEADTALADVGLTTTITGRIDAAISSRLASAGYTAPDNADIVLIKAKTDNLPANTSTTLSTLQTSVDDVPTNAELATALGTADDATLAAIAALTIPGANTIADAVLSRGVSNVQDTADTTSLAALILATFESSASGTTWTIRKTGGTTFVVKTLTLDASADPVIGVT